MPWSNVLAWFKNGSPEEVVILLTTRQGLSMERPHFMVWWARCRGICLLTHPWFLSHGYAAFYLQPLRPSVTWAQSPEVTALTLIKIRTHVTRSSEGRYEKQSSLSCSWTASDSEEIELWLPHTPWVLETLLQMLEPDGRDKGADALAHKCLLVIQTLPAWQR